MMTPQSFPLLDEFLQAVRYNDSALVTQLVNTIRGDSTTEEIAQCLIDNISALPSSATRTEEILEVASKLGVDGNKVKENDMDDTEARIEASISQHDLARLTYDTRKRSRCKNHEHVEEWIACPQCRVCFEALNEFASCCDPEDEACCLDGSVLKDEQMMILGVDQGWDKFRNRPEFDSSWMRQAKFDGELEMQRIVRPVDRLAYFIVRYWWRFKLTSFEKRSPNMLPGFLRPIPAQLSTPHDAAIDICPFPMLRHKLIIDGENYKTDYFWQPYLTSLRFFWPFDFADAITQDSRTSVFQFSLAFRQAVCQSENWSLAGEFFDIFPEFHGDAPKYIPDRRTNLTLTSLHWSKQQSMLLHKKQCSSITAVSEVTSRSSEGDSVQGRQSKRVKILSKSPDDRPISLQPWSIPTPLEISSDIDEKFWRASGCR